MDINETSSSALKGISNRLRSSAAFKAVLLVILCLFAAIPLSQIHDLRSEREGRQLEAADEIASQWGKSQSVIGPILVVPASYEEVVSESVFVNGLETIRKKTIARRITVCMLPDSFRFEADLESEWLYRGIFRSPVYRSKAHIEGGWVSPDMEELGYPEAELDWEACRVLFKVEDPRGLNAVVGVVDGEELVARPSSGGPFKGEWTRLGSVGFAESPKEFAIDFELRGSRFFGFLPCGKEGEAAIRSGWANPSFDGCLLPEERTVGADGFEALYRFSEFGRGMPQAWIESERRSLEPMFADAISGVDLIDPINNYRLVDRSLKYGLLFVGVGFGVFFLFETLRRLNLHPMQYVLAGGGIVMFFLLLLSLSEVIAFGWAYLWSTLASASLVGLYAGSILDQGRQGLAFGAVMAAMFGFLYIVLRQQDLALLAGSAFVFSALALVMYLTRKLDWSRSLESGR
jgi:inner membrane protein